MLMEVKMEKHMVLLENTETNLVQGSTAVFLLDIKHNATAKKMELCFSHPEVMFHKYGHKFKLKELKFTMSSTSYILFALGPNMVKKLHNVSQEVVSNFTFTTLHVGNKIRTPLVTSVSNCLKQSSLISII